MRLTLLFLLPFMALSFASFSQNDPDSLRQATIDKYYTLALKFKDGDFKGGGIDYKQAFDNFTLAYQLGDDQSAYAIGYFYYKGFYVPQNYDSAAAYFSQGAYKGRTNSMYFYALCLRNGYGIVQNKDSAIYYLKICDSLNYKQATLELAKMESENGHDSARILAQQIKNAALPKNTTPNQFTKVTHYIPDNGLIPGVWDGYVIQYDWSGKQVVSTHTLNLTIDRGANKVKGTWIENLVDTVPISATLGLSRLTFDDATKYKRKDHYSDSSGIGYIFQEASLNLVQSNDSLFMAGNIALFSTARNETSKPITVLLTRKIIESPVTATTVSANPNPFTSTLNVNINLAKASSVEVQLISMNGNILYRNVAGVLQPGHYQLPLEPGGLAAGSYILKLIYGSQTVVTKVLKM